VVVGVPIKRQRVLELLRAGGSHGVTTGELLAAGVGARYGARLLELRADSSLRQAV
jgi:hypothetical protein